MKEDLCDNRILSFLMEEDSSGLHLSAEKVKALEQSLHRLLEDRKVFLQQSYSLPDMAHELNLSTHQLSAFINQVLKKHFTDLVNQYRIDYCLENLNNGSFTTHKVYQLSEACGFNTRNTFTTTFKKFTGRTPQQYLQS